MKDRIPTVCARELGAAVVRARRWAGYNGSELAWALGWTPGAMSRLESGKRVWSESTDLALLLGVCGVTGAEAEEVLGWWRDAHLRTWRRSHLGQSPDCLDVLIRQESIAATIIEYEPLTVPSLLSTEDYIRAVLQRGVPMPEETIELWVQKHRQRQAIFTQPARPAFVFYLSEHCLRRPVADVQVMNDQLQQMALATVLPHCEIRVIPAEYGDLVIEPFRLMEYTDYNPVVYLPSLTASLYLEEPGDVAAYRAVVARLDEVALDPRESHELLQHVADEFDRRSTPHQRAPNDPPTSARPPGAVSAGGVTARGHPTAPPGDPRVEKTSVGPSAT